MAIGLGGNTSETVFALSRARVLIAILLESVRFSSLSRTAPQDDVDQAPFWNAVAVGNWGGSAESLLERLLMIEAREGRIRDPLRPKGPRVLDLDLLVFGSASAQGTRLTVPHPGLAYRRFVLEPLLEIAEERFSSQQHSSWNGALSGVFSQTVDRSGEKW